MNDLISSFQEFQFLTSFNLYVSAKDESEDKYLIKSLAFSQESISFNSSLFEIKLQNSLSSLLRT